MCGRCNSMGGRKEYKLKPIDPSNNRKDYLLSERELKVLYLRYGLADGNEYTFREIGDMLGVYYTRVQQIHITAINKLRRHPEVWDLYEFIHPR